MISITLEGKKKTHVQPSYSHLPAPKPTSTLGIRLQERDDLIKKLYKECPYNIGDFTVVDSTDQNVVDEYGDVEVLHICKSIFDFGKRSEWPAEGNPLIVTAYSKKANRHFFCTTNYLKKKV